MTPTIKFFENVIKVLRLDEDNPNCIEQFDHRRFKFGAYLLNPDGEGVKIRKGAIDELVIVDDILDWFHTGNMTFTNPHDIMERVTSQHVNDTIQGGKVDISPYTIRGDARDFLYIRMEPHIDTTESDAPTSDVNSVVHTMKFLFSIYAVEDVISDSGSKDKKQKIYFHDYRAQILREKNTYYSTAKNVDQLGDQLQYNQSVTQTGDTNRSKNTGEIIQDLLSSALLKTDVSNLFSRQWEFGENEMLYTSPAEYKAIDDINYVLNRHVSSSNSQFQPCVLKLQRYTDRWELLPIQEYFERSNSNKGPGPYQSEFFLLAAESESESTDTIIPPPRKTFGRDKSNAMINYHYPDISIVDDYVFSEMNGVDCQEILNSVVVHSYSERSKTFNINITDGNIQNVQQEFQSMFVNKTYGGESGHGVTAWISDKSREENFNISVKSSWTPNSQLNLAQGRNKKLLAAFLLGNSIQFTSTGASSRRSGVWFALDRDNMYVDNKYDNKLLGQYFTTRVTHTITATGYSNSIIGVKPFLFRSNNFNTTDIFYKNTEQLNK